MNTFSNPAEFTGSEVVGGNLVPGIEKDHFHVVGTIQGIGTAGGKGEGLVDSDFNKFLVAARARTAGILFAGGEYGSAEKDGGNHQCEFFHVKMFNRLIFFVFSYAKIRNFFDLL